ncbi:hypothetical protein JX265_013473 [Neoarthrinium moseri]|uniref:LisH domain-containing protein n=1 Tax=Neoarthrinium moseri TaxID=1658444 RepID=A0A9P9W8E2_9PEZI|nr:uncharacterized protein JN550_013032 [Neoarthrinium moseri]KAI1841373.1 hypothetical protein JX266_012454 [Neoarthrinium moseri]KAI1850194.1 hypothetical protein JX265_013473 [Neoarthrinium moseri]KAI1857834.1 hypothetical protein JN550_013032 [Neoarthrinium moseri]
MNNVGMANMNAMAGPVGGPMPMAMNNGAMPGAQHMQQQQMSQKSMLNTYIYDYFLKENMHDLARSILSYDPSIITLPKDSPGRRRDEGGLGGDDAMDTDSKDELEKRPSDLPAANVPATSDSCFLYEWFALFWDMLNGHRGKPGGNSQVNQYIHHTQQQNRLKQSQQQEMLRQMRPEMQFNPAAMIRTMPNGMQMAAANKNNLARTAMANNQNNPQAMALMQQQAKQNQMQREPSDMEGNRRPASPGSTDNAPSPKRARLDGNAPFNGQQAGMMPNGRPQQQGMPGQQVGNGPVNMNSSQVARVQAATQLLIAHDIDPKSLTPEKFQNFANQPPNTQKASIQSYSQNLQQHHGQQMPNKGMAQPGNPQGQGSPMMPQPNPADISTMYNTNDFAPGGMRPGPANGQGGGSNHALQDYQMQLMLLEQQNKKRLMMARQEQDSMGGMQPRADGPAGPGGPGGPGGPAGPNGQPFPDASPQGVRTGASPNPSEQMKRGTPQMGPAGIPSPLPEGAQSRGSPNPMGFMPGANMDPNMAGNPQFFKGMNGMDGGMAQMNGGAMRPPSSHPQPFNGQMTPQMMAARQQGGQGAPNQMQWQGGPNGAMVPQGPQGPSQGTPQQRAMPPPSAPGAGANAANGRAQPASPAPSNAAPPTPQQANKAAPKKKDSKAAKSKAAAQKKTNATTGATPAADASQDSEPTPATPITPANSASFGKNGQGAANAPPVPNAQTSAPPAPTAPVAPPAHADPSAGFGMDNGSMNMDFGLDFANPMNSDNVLQDFDFDSFLHDGDGGETTFDFNPTTFDMQGTGEITTE